MLCLRIILPLFCASLLTPPIHPAMASPRSPSRGRSRTRSHTPTSLKRALSPDPHRSRSPHRSPSPRSRSRSRSPSRTPNANQGRNGYGPGRRYSRSPSRSRSPNRADRRPYRERSYTRSVSRGRNVQSSKIVVEKLTRNVHEGHLREIFGSYGTIQSIDLPLNKQCKDFPVKHSRQKLTIRSHDQPRHRIHPVRPPIWLRIRHRTHARSPTRRQRHQRQHRPPSPRILSLTTTRPLQPRPSTTVIHAQRPSPTWSTFQPLPQPSTRP